MTATKAPATDPVLDEARKQIAAAGVPVATVKSKTPDPVGELFSQMRTVRQTALSRRQQLPVGFVAAFRAIKERHYAALAARCSGRG